MSNELLGLLNALDDTEAVREQVLRSAFAYPGAKSRSLKEIVPRLPYRSGYGEAFGGSGIVLLNRNSSKLEVFNDRYAGVTCFYRVIRDRLKMNKMIDRLQVCLHSREEFVWCRDTWKDLVDDDVERAARWYYSVLSSFAAQGRNFGRCTSGKAQMGPKLKNNLKLFPEIHLRMLHTQVENQDWRECLRDYDHEDFVWYLDPPYYSYAKGMYEHELDKSEHIELLERIFHLRGFVALSGYENPLYDKYPWDNRYSWNVIVTSLSQGFTETNNLAGHEDTMKRGTAKEVLWVKEAK